ERHDARAADLLEELIEMASGHLVGADDGSIDGGTLGGAGHDPFLDEAVEARLHRGGADRAAVAVEGAMGFVQGQRTLLPKHRHDLQLSAREPHLLLPHAKSLVMSRTTECSVMTSVIRMQAGGRLQAGGDNLQFRRSDRRMDRKVF